MGETSRRTTPCSGVRTRPRSTKHGSCLPVPPKSDAGLPGNPEPAFTIRAPERTSPCRITYTRGRAPFSTPRVARRNLRMCFRLIRAVSTRLAHQSTRVSIWHSVPNRVGASGAGLGWPCALEGKGGPTRSSLGERGAVPAGRLDRLAFPARTHAVQMSSRGVRAAAGIDR